MGEGGRAAGAGFKEQGVSFQILASGHVRFELGQADACLFPARLFLACLHLQLNL